MQTRLARWLLSLILLASSVAVSLSPLNRQYAAAGWGSVALGSVLGLAIVWRHWDGRFRLSRLVLRPEQVDAQHRISFSLLDLALLATIASATSQTLVTLDLPASRFLPINDTPAINILYLLFAGALAFLAVALAAVLGNRGRSLSALLAAGLFSSTLYLRTFATPEAGPAYASLFAFALLAASTLWCSSPERDDAVPRNWSDRVFALASLIFLAAVALAVLFSPVPRQSLDLWLRWATLLALAVLLSLSIRTVQTWRAAAWGIVILAGVLPILLACLKLVSLIPSFGLLAALSYRLHPSELGGANLIARSILCVVPLAIALAHDAHRRIARWIGWAVFAGGAFVMLYSRSWEGVFALLAGLGSYAVTAYWQKIRTMTRRMAATPLRKWLAVTGLASVAVILSVLSIRAAKQVNIYSFNARLIHWHGALLAWRDHPWVGAGPGNELVYAAYADEVGLFVDTQVTTDAPLPVIGIEAGRSLQAHAHDLLLELGATGGVIAVLAFGVVVFSIVVIGLRTWQRSSGSGRYWIAGCLAGIAGALAWGVLDVLWVSPPFFSFPVWGLIGLLLAASRATAEADQEQVPGNAGKAAHPGRRRAVLVLCLLVALALLTVLLPALESLNYQAGFVALQERRWSDAVSHLETSSRLGWLNPQAYPLLAEACLAEGNTEAARKAYERAASLKSGYSAYLSQLGWFAWLDGDLDNATEHFEEAVDRDPSEVGRYGLHSDLGLAYAAQGMHDAAVSAIKTGIKLFPESVLTPEWTTSLTGPAGWEASVDPVYCLEPSPELDLRILSKVGAPDVTERLFEPQVSAASPISLDDVLDAIEDDYKKARLRGDREAPLLLAALAEASRLAGLTERAEQAYLAFQALQPSSAFGFRDLGILYKEQGRMAQAQSSLEQAVEVSPRDVDSRYNLALVYMDLEMWDKAEEALDTIVSQAMVTQFRSRLFDPDLYLAQARLHRAQGDLEQAAGALDKAALIRGEPGDFLSSADLYRQLARPKEATEKCIQAAEALFRTWPRPLDPQLWDIGLCLAQSTGELPRQIASLARRHPLAGNVLVGHIHRARGELEPALTAYQAAADARPDQGAPHYFLGETYQALGQPEPAETEYRLAADLDRWESLPLLALGQMQWAQGRKEEALESLEAAVETTPGWGQTQVALGNALLAVGDRERAGKHYLLAQHADREYQQGLVHDLAAQLAEAQIEAPDGGYVKNDYFTIGGEERRVLFMHPDSSARYVVDVQADSKLTFEVATDPSSWDQPGDGVDFAVSVEAEGRTDRIFSVYVDPKQDPRARRWHTYSLDLSDYAGQKVTLVLETGSGPAGDLRFDWAGWGRPRLLAP